MQVLGSVFYGLISGFAEFLPISAQAHQYLFSYLTGFSGNSAFLKLMVYLGCLASILVCCRNRLTHMRRELRLASLPKKRRKRVPDMQAVSDFRLMITGLIPIILGILLQKQAAHFFGKLTWLCLMLILSGIFIYLPQYLPLGSRDSRSMNRLEGLALGFCCALSVIPGISRIGLMIYFGRTRRCSGAYCLDLALLFSIPVLLGMVLLQLIAVLSAGIGVLTSAVIASGVIAALAAFGAAVAGIALMRYLAVKLDFHGFSYYCWGLAVFCFIYYLMT